ncbi:alginate export family protein [Gemmatimonadota bacterium]
MPSAKLGQAVLTLALLAQVAPLGAQSSPVLTWHGEIRPRVLGREPVEGSWDHFTSMRSRVGLDARMGESLRLFFQVQDVRTWGEELGVRDRSADAIDFHQAFLEVGDLPGVEGTIRAGRQEVGLAEERLLGAPDWGQAGQTFDGARYIRPLGRQRLELLFLQLQEDSAPDHDRGAHLLAAWLALSTGPAGSADIFLVHDAGSGPAGNRQNSAGAVWRTDRGRFSGRFQGVYQFGERNGTDVSAFLLAARAGLSALDRRGSLTLWYDYLSGDGDPSNEQVRVFSTLFGARNRFYGRADHFTDIPDQTGGLGLQDAAVKLSFRPAESISVSLDLHSFRSASEGQSTSQRFGEEADFWVRVPFRQYLTLQAGYSLTRAGPLMEELELLEGTGHTAYLMTSLKF